MNGTKRDTGPVVHLARDASGIILRVDDGIADLLGWRPDELIGSPSTTFIHPEDQPTAVAAWMDMVGEAGSTRTFRGRYRSADGTWAWVETTNVNRLDDTEDPVVLTTMARITVEGVGIEEELRARKQLLSRLSDALPVGLVQIDRARQVTFTNDQLHAIVGGREAATLDALLCDVVEDDRPLLATAVSAVLADQPVDEIELRLTVAGAPRVCLLSLRALTDGAGHVSGAIGCLSDVTDRVQLRRELEIRASVDELTGCLNRAATLELLTLTVAQHGSGRAGTGVVFIDLDGFKLVNDVLGHAAGDELLVLAANRLQSAVRGGDQVGRMGGDEFLVVCPSVSDAATALEIGTRIAELLHASVDVGAGMVDLQASVGVAWSSDPVDADSLIARADSAMYASKRAGLAAATLFAAAA